MNIIICDDQKYICDDIKKFAKDYLAKRNIDGNIWCFFDVSSVLADIRLLKKCDLLFLDIQLPDGTGIDVAKFIRNEIKNYLVEIVIISTYEHYTQMAIHFNVLDYLIKPIRKVDVMVHIDRTLEKHNQIVSYFCYKIRGHRYQQDIEKILYFESIKRQIRMVCYDKKDVLFYDRLDTIESEHQAHDFWRIHHSYLVNYRNIKEVSFDNVTMINNDVIKISRNYRDETKKRLQNR
jgi:DNA-binding LytR/AlgR family response regulator